MVAGLDPRDIANLSLFLKARDESEPSFISHLSVRKKSKTQQLLLVLTVNRIYLMRRGCEKVDSDGHIRDLKRICSPSETSIVLEFHAG